MSNVLLEEMLMQLQIEQTTDLYPHEQIIEKNLKRLKEAMLNIGQLVDPLIIDKKSKVVLDGNHRLSVLKAIECPNAVCQSLDYADGEIKVGTWYPASKKQPEFKNDVSFESIDFQEGLKTINASEAPFMMVKNTKKEARLLKCNDPQDIASKQSHIVSHLAKTDIEYIPDDQAQKYLDLGYTVFYRRIYSKEEVIKTALAKKPFPPKSTRHIIPNRIIRLNMRLGWLHESRENAFKSMTDMLKNRVYDGNVRRYVEPVIVVY